ncbi:DoxX family protein [Bdellovibrio sp. KM01]|uniref:DoxX family protein n=1 Tax=Bdellovibrio sp. KM01 TaxID=2748865 RepID=UPI0015E9A487|nr:DoxX family protein [Bdellovibrio sp. KM01]QLY26563.1 DoxX family protein [Bdellovibrio sp. KM01]
MNIKNFLFATNTGTTGQVGLAIFRIFVGLVMAFVHGLGKFPISEQLIQGVASIGFPMPVMFAHAAALSELVGGVLLALGLLTRPAAIFMAFTMFVAGTFVHAADPFNVKELAFLYMFVCIFFACYGGGRFSLDNKMGSKV